MFLRLFFCCVLLLGLVITSSAQFNADAYWISTMESQSESNTWLAYRKQIELSAIPERVQARIAVDSKYWLWINGELVVFEGGLKRGPNPKDTYYDELDIAAYLKPGNNVVAILVWYFGKDGFSHKSSGRAGLLFDSDIGLKSDESWKSAVIPAYQAAGEPYPNFRLSESSIRYDARLGWESWYLPASPDSRMPSAQIIGRAGDYPWNTLVKRPIPQWKNSGIQRYTNELNFPFVSTGDTLVCELPYNAQVTPYLEVEAVAGQEISMLTDNYLTYHGSATNVRAEYVAKDGLQQYEALGWMNGHKMYYVIPKGVKVLNLGYRETGYDTDFSGSFSSSEPFFNLLWEKSLRTLYLNIRDSYMDCPERERAQWTGDAVNQSGQSFYALSTSSHDMVKKWLYELVGWQREDGSIYAPVPTGNWTKELPCQVTASLGYYGLWNYYWHTGDRKTLSELYDGAKQYLALWETNVDGTVKMRMGGWTWGDWGDNRDMLLIYNLWYYLGLKGMWLSAAELGNISDEQHYKQAMDNFKTGFNARFWNGSAYRDPAYTGATDDRVQAMAVVSGVAEATKFSAIMEVLRKEEHASPYMEKYVFEAMFQMGYENEALTRHKKRFSPMVNDTRFTTLFEGWGIGSEGYGGGTVNHSWSGGGLIILSQYVCGIAPLEPGYKTFQVIPQPGSIHRASAVVPSVAGEIRSGYEVSKRNYTISATVPQGTNAVLGVPEGYRTVKVNGTYVIRKGKHISGGQNKLSAKYNKDGYHLIEVSDGEWKLEAF